MSENSHYQPRVQIELTRQLYKQIKGGLWGESIVAIALTVALWGAINSNLLLFWLFSNLLLCGLARHLLVYYFNKVNKSPILNEANFERYKMWLGLFALGAVLSGISWGIVGSALMVQHDIVRQSFTTFLLFGMVSAANPFYSFNRLVYALFLLPALIPFSIWLLLQGGIFIILGFLVLVYMVIMLYTSAYFNQLIRSSLNLNLEKNKLIDDLSNAKTKLENDSIALEKSLALVKATLEATTNGILVVNAENQIVDYNQKFIDIWSISDYELKDRNIRTLIIKLSEQLIDPVIFVEKFQKLYLPTSVEGADELHFTDGRIFERYSYPQKIGNQCVGRVWTFRDITENKLLESQLFHKANFDSLTNLPNRSLLLDRLSQSITYCKQSKLHLAVMYVDIDRFKLINDTLGHMIGEKLLIEVARRLEALINENDTISREGGDEFVVVVSALESETDPIGIARKFLTSISEPFYIDSNKINITISIGISFYPKDGSSADTLMGNADIAMYRAKEMGRNNFQFFTEEMNKKVLTRLLIENQLRRALEANELSLRYQPIVSLKTGYIVGTECLLRWSNPQMGAISPNDFISVAEESGMIVPIGEWVLRSACAQLKEWQKKGHTQLHMAVNLSGIQFKQPHFFEKIKEILLGMDLDPHQLVIELTESIIMDNAEKNIETMRMMKDLGIKVVIDDFGVGYSNLGYLRRLPIAKIKIDKSFIKDITTKKDDAAITSAILALASELNLAVIAEGVENKQQLDFLYYHDCAEIQGFLYSKPLDAEACLKLIEENKRLPLPAFSI